MSEESKSIGEELREAREAKGWSIAHAAYETKLRREVIERIESDRYDLLPNPAYARGFIRIYARELGVDSFGLLKKLDGVVDDEILEFRAEALESLPSKTREDRLQLQRLGFGVVVLLVMGAFLLGIVQLYRVWPVVFGGGELGGGQKEEMEEVVVNDETEAGQDATKETQKENMEVRRAEPIAKEGEGISGVEAIADGKNHLKLSADEDCWVKVVIVEDGVEKSVFEDVVLQGKSVPNDEDWVGDAFIVTVRDAALVNVIYNGKNYGKYEGKGRQKFRIPAGN